MMNFLRRKMKIFLWIILVTFVGGLFLMQYSAKKFSTAVAEVNGVEIPYETYKQQLYQRLQNWRSENPEEDLKDENVTAIKQDIIGFLIMEEILWQEAEEYNLSISDRELQATIQSFPQFQKDGQFHRELYFQTLNYAYRTTPDKFEERIRKALVTEKVKRLIVAGIKITGQEIESERARRGAGEIKEGEEDSLPMTIYQGKAFELRNQWLETLYSKAKISNNLAKLETRGL